MDESRDPDTTASGSRGARDAGPDRPTPTHDRLASPDRLVALADGVFAIVLTILVLEIAVPENLSGDSLRLVLEDLRPTVVAWVVSFLITGMYWVGHRDVFAAVRTVNRDLVWLNLVFLLPVALIPFAASVLGKYPDEPVALYLYGAVLISASAVRFLLLRYVLRRPALLWPDAVDQHARVALIIAASPILVYLLAIAVAGVSTGLSTILFFSVPLLYFLLVTLLRERAGTRAKTDEIT
jgi:uncharacterized membrane protein